MLNLTVIKNNRIMYNGKVIKLYIEAKNFGPIEIQQGCSNAIYKIHRTVRYINEKNEPNSLEINSAIAKIAHNNVEIVS